MWILLGLLVFGAVVFFFCWGIILNNNNLYCKFFLPKERKNWEKFIKLAPSFHCISVVPDEFSLKIFRDDSGKYEAVIWKSGLCSIHSTEENRECLVSTFDETMSKKMSDLLIKNT
jgi:hypothetical protein